MNEQAFSLKPFEKDPFAIELKGSVARRKNILTVSYELTWERPGIEIPARKRKPSRLKGLWEGTCFELFLAPRDIEKYWEINVSPSGDWNVFRFNRYEEVRRISDLQEEALVDSLASTTRVRPGALSLGFEFDLEKLVHDGQVLDIGISTIVRSNKRTFWALVHCGSQPDFHRRDSFILSL